MLLRGLSILSFSLALACSGCFLLPSPDDSPPISEPLVTAGSAEETWALEIGQGESSFAPMEDGAHVAKVRGTQGGHHVLVAARLQGPNVRDEIASATTSTSSSYSYVHVEVEVVAGDRLVSRSLSMHSVQALEATNVDLYSLYAYVDADVRGDVTITVKVATEDKSKWAAASHRVVVD